MSAQDGVWSTETVPRPPRHSSGFLGLTIPAIWQAWDEDLLTLGQTVAALAAHGVTV